MNIISIHCPPVMDVPMILLLRVVAFVLFVFLLIITFGFVGPVPTGCPYKWSCWFLVVSHWKLWKTFRDKSD